MQTGQKPIIVITGHPDWRETITKTLEEKYSVHHQPQLNGYMNTLIDSLAALVLVDSANADWVTWTSTPKASPATRRIPLILVSDDPDIRANASSQGADLALSYDDLHNNILKWVDDIARVPDPEKIALLKCECQEPLPELAQQGIRMFNEGQYYKQHDLFEELWMETETPIRNLYRAVLQVGIAYFQIERGNYRGALKMLQRSVQWLVTLPDTCQGIDVKKLREDSFKVRAELERLGENRLEEFNKELIKGVSYNP